MGFHISALNIESCNNHLLTPWRVPEREVLFLALKSFLSTSDVGILNESDITILLSFMILTIDMLLHINQEIFLIII